METTQPVQKGLTRLWASITLLALMSAPTLAGCSSSSSSSTQFPAETRAELETMFTSQMELYKVVGGTFGAWCQGKEFVSNYGLADREANVPMTPNAPVRVGSITKTFVATVFLKLVDQGLVSLDDTLDKWYPTVPSANQITMTMLLQHTSGLYNYINTDYPPNSSQGFLTYVVDNPLATWNPTELAFMGADHAPYFPPGTSWTYSNTNYIFLALIAQQLTGKTIETMVDEMVIGPMGLTNTTFPTTPAMPTGYARGYWNFLSNGSPYVPLNDFSIFDPSSSWSAGAIISTRDDLITFTHAMVNNSYYDVEKGTTVPLLSEATQAARMSLYYTDFESFTGDQFGYGLGIMYIEGYYGHGGQIFPYFHTMFYDPKRDCTIMVEITRSDDNNIPVNTLVWANEIIYGTGTGGARMKEMEADDWAKRAYENASLTDILNIRQP